MAEEQPQLPDDLAAPDIYTLDIAPGGYQDAREMADGQLQIEMTPEQAEKFEQFVTEEFA